MTSPSGAPWPDRPVIFDHAGRTYELPRLADWPLKVILSLAKGNLQPFAQLLGEHNFTQLTDDGYTLGQLHDLVTRAAGPDDADTLLATLTDPPPDGPPGPTCPPT